MLCILYLAGMKLHMNVMKTHSSSIAFTREDRPRSSPSSPPYPSEAQRLLSVARVLVQATAL